MPLHDAATVAAGGSPSTNGGSQLVVDRRLFNPATGAPGVA